MPDEVILKIEPVMVRASGLPSCRKRGRRSPESGPPAGLRAPALKECSVVIVPDGVILKTVPPAWAPPVLARAIKVSVRPLHEAARERRAIGAIERVQGGEAAARGIDLEDASLVMAAAGNCVVP